ncbi:MAG: sulfatase [Gemmatimonadales bacterium]|nr:MAG: sulfatase [Gemmatimonadales bacterium]
MNQPNIVFVFADDWGRYAGAYAALEGPKSLNALMETPNFDRVAREGVLFTNAVVPAPSCTPCRSSILSGQYFWQTGLGAILQGARWDERIPTYPLELEKAGYHIGHTYKVWSPGKTANAPYGARRTQYQSAGDDFGHFSHWVTANAPELGVEGAKEQLYQETRLNFDEFLAARNGNQPFCYWWGPTNTHRTWERGSGKALWGLEPDALTGRLPAFLPDVPEIREDVCDYLGECMAVDGGLGVIMSRLEEIGELENTLLVVSGDHGIPGIPRAKCNLYDIGSEVALAVRWPGHGTPGRVVDDMVNLMDLAPTFLEAAGVTIPETMSATSLLPVLESTKNGQVDPARCFAVTGRERHVADAREGFLPYPQRAIRTAEYLYIRNYETDRWPMGDPKGLDDLSAEAPSVKDLTWVTRTAYADMDAGPTKAWMIHHRNDDSVRPLFDLAFGKRPAHELYHLSLDPDYMENIADDPTHAQAKARLAAKLDEILTAQDDPRVTRRPCPFEHGAYVAPPE